MKFLLQRKLISRAALLLFFLSVKICSAQQNLSFQHYTSENGLSADGIDHIAQDKYGFMWFGSANGLNRFDGKNFTVYHYNPNDTNSLCNDIINAICTDSTGRLWAATNAGLCYYSLEDDRFHTINTDQSNSETLDRHRIYGVVCAADQTIWYATRTELHALYRNGSIKTFPLYFNNQQTITTLLEDHEARMWIGCNYNQLICFDEKSNQTFSLQPANVSGKSVPITIAAISQYGNDSLWIGTWDAGFQLLTMSDKQFRPLPFVNAEEKNTSKWICGSICRASSSQLWVASYGNGLGLYDIKNGKFILRLSHDPANPASLCNNYVNTVFRDSYGILWIATNNGLDEYDPLMHQFSWVNLPPVSSSKSLRNFPGDVIENKTDPQKLWISVAGTGLFLYDRSGGQFTLFSHRNRDSLSLPDNDVYVLFRDHSGTLWLGTKAGVCTLDETKNIFHPLRLKNENNTFTGSVIQIIEDHQGLLWLATFRSGVYCYDPLRKELTSYHHDSSDAQSIPDDHVFCILEDHEGRIWAGTQSRGLCRLDEQSGNWTSFEHQRGNIHSLPDDNVYDVLEDEYKQLWIATSGGLALLNLKNDSMKTFTTADGLCNNDIYSINEDLRKHLWLCTYNGLSEFNPQQKTFKNYFTTEGLPVNSLDGACTVLSDGTVFIGAPNGFSYFHPDSLRTNPRIPTVMITSFRIFDKPVQLIRNGVNLQPLYLSYRQNEITFTFGAMNFTDADKNQFAYKLEGFDQDWTYCGNKTSATYTNLNGGTYTFLVKAANNDGIWNETGTHVSLMVAPPFWKTWWFYLIVTLFITSLLYLAYRIRIRQIMKLQRMRLRIARDLHDDIGSTLSSITMMSQMAANNSSSAKELPAEIFGTIGRASRQAMELMSDIVWSVNPQNDKMENVIIRMRQYASEILEATKINFRIETDAQLQQVSLPMEKRKDFFLIFKEAINNLAKYSAATDVLIQISVQNHSVNLLIRDNGKGFDSAKSFSGNGLKNMRARSSSLNGKFQLSSCTEGTTVSLTVPLIP